jgi:ATP-dependent DNA helicase DinG
VDVADTLRDRLFDRVPSVVLTSATLTTAATKLDPDGEATVFAFARSRLGAVLGVAEVRELVVESPFDFASRALLYLPKDLPAPNDPEFVRAMAERSQHLIDAADGGAFVLTTSLRTMHAVHRLLAATNPTRTVLVQGQAPKHSLLASFRSQPRCVLVATLSFWEGVDVPGDALRLVVLEKIPFSVPSDPVLQARAAALQEEGRNPFTELFLPLAQMTLKQGFGRLIRTTRDFGVVALMDSRVHQRGYGQRLLKQLPDARRTSDLSDAIAFLEAGPAVASTL